MKVVLICTTYSVVVGFRAKLIECLQENGYDVRVIADFSKATEAQIRALPFATYHVPLANTSLNVFASNKYKNTIKTLIEQIQPDKVFTFMTKPNTFGAMGAVKGGAKELYCMIEGLGRPFVMTGVKGAIVRKLTVRYYRKGLKHAKKIFILNSEIGDILLSEKCATKEQLTLINGIGVDTEKFAQAPLPEGNIFIMVARLTVDKGIIEYLRAAEIVKQKLQDTVFKLYGSEDDITVSDISQYIDAGIVEYCGVTDDVVSALKASTFFVLPSYAEGMPVSTLEAMSVGRPIITTDTRGCRETVDGTNGVLVPVKDHIALAKAMERLITDRQLVERMAKRSREIAEKKFSAKIINEKILEIIS